MWDFGRYNWVHHRGTPLAQFGLLSLEPTHWLSQSLDTQSRSRPVPRSVQRIATGMPWRPKGVQGSTLLHCIARLTARAAHRCHDHMSRLSHCIPLSATDGCQRGCRRFPLPACPVSQQCLSGGRPSHLTLLTRQEHRGIGSQSQLWPFDARRRTQTSLISLV